MHETVVDIPESAALLVDGDARAASRPATGADTTTTTTGSPQPILAFAIKRTLDVLGAVLLLVLALPLLLVLAAIVTITSPGPAIYRSRRVGRAGRQFDCLKFRTMVDGADLRQAELEVHNEADGPLFKIADDPRITPIGAWLRRTSLDELPQLLNVLFGQMSLVGPRPLPLRDVALLQDADHRRHALRPGMTGVWQVSPERHSSGTDIIALDLEYVDTWSLGGDVVLLLRTAFVVLDGVIGRRGDFD